MEPMTRRNFLRTTLAATAAGATGTWVAAGPAYPSPTRADGVTTGTRPRPFLAYSVDSYFRSRVSDAPVDHERTREFRSFMRSHPDQRDYAHPRINGVAGNEWGTAFAMATAADPVWRVRTRTNENPRGEILETTGFHAPEWLGDMLTGTDDSPFCVIDRASGFTVFCTEASVVGPRLLDIRHGGVTYHGSRGLNYKNPRCDDERNLTSRGRISDSMVIRQDLVSHGVANDTDLGHVLHMFFVETNSADGYRHPMTGAEKGKHGFGAEGERIAIASSVDLTSRGLSPEALVIARTLQNHGCYLGDNSGSASCLKAEQENGGRPVWDGRLGRDSLEGITWDDFVVIASSGP